MKGRFVYFVQTHLEVLEIIFYPWYERNQFENTFDGKAKGKGEIHVAQDVSEHKRCAVILHGLSYRHMMRDFAHFLKQGK